MKRDPRSGKVGLIGTGMVGSSFAYCLMQSGLVSDLVLIDADRGRAEGEAMDLNHGLAFVRPMTIRAGEYADLTDAKVVVITAGANQRPGQSRLDLLQRNAAVIRDVVPKITAVCPETTIVVATNPVDILTQIAEDVAALPAGRVLGSGTTLDTARLRFLLGGHYAVDPRSVHAYVVAEHGDSALALWSMANVAGVRLEDFVSGSGRGYDRPALDAIFEQVRKAAYEIIQRKGSTYYAIGLALLSVVEAILRDQHTVLTVCSTMRGRLGLEGIALSLPSIVGASGIEAVLEIPMSDEERDGFRRSAAILSERLAELG
ncbi:MAG: L-lactate dehydrogenase [Isosphaeraceae bacterium]|nr:L-lactate dehydrogenase [Isosphaeraceae bacterium]